MKGPLKTLSMYLKLWLCLCLLLPQTGRGQVQNFVPANESYSQFYNSITIAELESINLTIAQLLRQSLYWGTPGSSDTPPTQSQVNQLADRLQSWKASLGTHLPQLLSTAHPLSPSGYSRLGVEVSLYFEAARKIELLKYLNQMGAPLEVWKDQYSLNLSLDENADQLFLEHLTSEDLQSAAATATFIASLQIENDGLYAKLDLNPELIEEFELKALGRFQASNASAVKLAQLTGASFLLDNLAEVQFLLNEDLELLKDMDPYWSRQFPALAHKSVLWTERLQQRRLRFIKDNILSNQLESIAQPVLQLNLLSQDFTRDLADDFLTAWKITGEQKTQNIDAIASVYSDKLSFAMNSKLSTYLSALLRLWNPKRNLTQEQIAAELRTLAVSAFGHMLRYELVYFIESLAPQRNLTAQEYGSRLYAVKTNWQRRIKTHLADLRSQLDAQSFMTIAGSLTHSLRGGVENNFKEAYVKDLVQKAQRTQAAVDKGEVQLWILNESLQGLYRENNLAVSLIEGAFFHLRHVLPEAQSPVSQNNFSISIVEALNRIASQPDYFSSQAVYFSTLGELLPQSLLASDVYVEDGSQTKLHLTQLQTKIESSDLQAARKQQIRDFLLAGQWMGFFENHDPLTPVNIDDLTALPEHVKDNYRHRLEHLTVNLHPIFSIQVSKTATSPRQHTPRMKLIEALKSASHSEASYLTEQALKKTEENIAHYLEVLKNPYKDSLIDQITGQTQQLKDEFYSVIRYSSLLKNEFAKIPDYASTINEWISQRETPSEGLLAWEATESFLFDKVLWVLLGVQLATFVARVSPLGKVGSFLGWMQSTVLAPVFGTGAQWLHRAILLGLGISIGGEIYQVVAEYNLLGQLEGMLQTTAYENGLVDSPTYFEQLETAHASSQALAIKLGILAAAMVAIVAAGSVIPRYLARRSFNKMNKTHSEMFRSLGVGPLTSQTTRAELEAAYSATVNRVRQLHTRIPIGQALRMKHELNLQFRNFLQSLNREGAAWQKSLHRSFHRQIRTLYLNNAEFAESLGYKLGEPLTSEMVSSALSRWQVYAQNGQISAFEWARIQDSAQQLLRAMAQREQVWSSSLLYGDGARVGTNTYANSTGAWNPELMQVRWKENNQPLRFEVTETNGMEIFTPVRTDLPLPARNLQWENLLEAPPTRLMLEDLRHLRWETL